MSMLERLAMHAVRQPESLALQGSRQQLNYAELYDGVVALAGRLRALKVRSLALDLDNGLAWALFDLAALEAGIALLPIAPFFSPAQVQHAVSQAAVEMVITDDVRRFSLRAPDLSVEERESWSLLGEEIACFFFHKTECKHSAI